MAKNIDLMSQKWLDIIFEGRNQTYGAYMLRQESSKRHIIAFTLSMTFIITSIFAALMIKKVNENNQHNAFTESLVISEYKLEPPPEEVVIHKPVAPPVVDLAKTIQYTNPKIKPDELVNEKEEIKAVSDILDDTRALVSIVDNANGRTDGLGVDPATLANQKVIVDQPAEDNTIYPIGVIEQVPSFPGGEAAMYEWLSKNINYPVIAQENNIQGKVVLQFVVGKNGEITDIIIARRIDVSLDKEAVRVIRSMPNWIPGRQGGVAVKVRYTLPIQFKLQ